MTSNQIITALCVAAGLIYFGYVVWKQVRFLRQGYQYRRLDESVRNLLAQGDPMWLVHERRPRWWEYPAGVALAVVIIALLILAQQARWL